MLRLEAHLQRTRNVRLDAKQKQRGAKPRAVPLFLFTSPLKR
jgi:hypothetical protein